MAARPIVKGTVEQVMSGELFSGLLLNDSDERAVVLEALLGKVVDHDTRVVWVGNPLRSPLTIERFLIQIVGPEVDLREERGPAELAHLIAKQVGHATRLLIVVQQPETIDAQTRDLLVRMGGCLGGEAVQVQFLFVASTSFTVPELAHANVVQFRPRLKPAPIDPPPQAWLRRKVAPLVLLLLSITIGVLFTLAPASHDGMPLTAPLPPTAEIASLRREFDAFLAQRTPPVAPMSEAEKDALFNGLLTYHRRE